MFDDVYRRLVGYVGGGEDPVDRDDVLAMQMVLRIEKADPPDRRALLIAAAQAAVLVCLDERAENDGPWAPRLDAWCDARIRKIARRARGKQWDDVQGLWGVTVDHEGAQARAFVPSRVGDVDRRITKLQIGGTDVDGEPIPAAPDGRDGLGLWLNPTLDMSLGKTAAQVGHASMLGAALFSLDEARVWAAAGCPLDVGQADVERWSQLTAAADAGTAAAVRDAGFTEIAPGSVTVIATRFPR
ncbi:peptidyl-tRNA hydrolase [Gordonia hydrophobica]|uniref:peptidyl-tRNA hydrolase n=1 Tax=Gordonia hydrophobica TaxID=40516 RepID=A0ABZ2U276_9ACTN|nr:peptidyl-tRNA hydrolase [Gordonia hydrophobica]MBM7366879.1 peptidyl-tRNA hydrolase [Gordonia hydrophobica]